MTTTRKSPLVPIAVAVAAAVALALVLFGTGSSGDDADNPSSAGEAGQQSAGSGTASDDAAQTLARRVEGDPVTKGDVDAPVVLVAYSEFQCPFCGKFARDTVPTLEEKYVADGTLRIEWRDFPYLGEESTTAAYAARAAAAQGKFWEFHDALYADQPPPNTGQIDQAYLEDVAEEVGLDLDRFRTDQTSDLTQKLVSRDFQEGQSIGVTGTPSFLINGTPVVGAQPVEVFEQAIDKAADEAQQGQQQDQ